MVADFDGTVPAATAAASSSRSGGSGWPVIPVRGSTSPARDEPALGFAGADLQPVPQELPGLAVTVIDYRGAIVRGLAAGPVHGPGGNDLEVFRGPGDFLDLAGELRRLPGPEQRRVRGRRRAQVPELAKDPVKIRGGAAPITIRPAGRTSDESCTDSHDSIQPKACDIFGCSGTDRGTFGAPHRGNRSALAAATITRPTDRG